MPEITICLAQHLRRRRVRELSRPRRPRTELAAARVAQQDIQVAIRRLRVREDKVRLAEILWPVLLTKYERELEAGRVVTAVLRLIEDVKGIYGTQSASWYVLSEEPPRTSRSQWQE